MGVATPMRLKAARQRQQEQRRQRNRELGPTAFCLFTTTQLGQSENNAELSLFASFTRRRACNNCSYTTPSPVYCLPFSPHITQENHCSHQLMMLMTLLLRHAHTHLCYVASGCTRILVFTLFLCSVVHYYIHST